MTKILIVENERVTTDILQKYITENNHNLNTTSVANEHQALHELRKNRYDLLIAEMQTDQIDGIELIRQSKQVSPNLLAILLTEYSTPNVQTMARHLPVFRALAKPVSPSQLITCVEDALNNEIATMQHLTHILEKLRIDLGATSAILAQNTGNTVAYTGHINKKQVDATLTLLGGSMSASITLAKQMGQENFSKFSYFQGPPHDLYIASVGDDHFLTVFYDSKRQNSRVGLVWHYMQTAVASLNQAIPKHIAQVQPSSFNGFAQSIETQMDDLLGSIPARTAMLPNLSYTTLPQKLATVLQKFEKQTSLKVESHLEALPDSLPTSLNKLLLGFIGEGLKNVHQHAQATIVGISFYYDSGELVGRIVDNGKGFYTPPALKKLKKMIQEVETIGGHASLTGQPERGTTLCFHIPYEQEA